MDAARNMMVEPGPAAALAARWWVAKLETGDGLRFRSVLEMLVSDHLSQVGSARLVVDFDPRGLMLTALRQSGIPCSGACYSAAGILPFHHALLVFPDRLLTMEGLHNWTGVLPVPGIVPQPAGSGMDAARRTGSPQLRTVRHAALARAGA